jgi:tetratricopeptide (TPR) repeat protein
VRSLAQECVALAERLGSKRQLAEGVTILAMLACFRGDFERASELFVRLLDIGQHAENDLHQAWGLCGLGECLVRRGAAELAIGMLLEAGQLLRNRKDLTEEFRVEGLLSFACWRSGRPDDARQHAERLAELFAVDATVTVSTLEGLSGVMEYYLGVWEKGAAGAEVRRQARQACTRLDRYAGRFPVGEPRLLRYRGLLHWLGGRRARAWSAWRRSLRRAQRLDLPVEVALAHHELGRHMVPGEPQRAVHLSTAERLFQELGMAGELEQVREEMRRR